MEKRGLIVGLLVLVATASAASPAAGYAGYGFELSETTSLDIGGTYYYIRDIVPDGLTGGTFDGVASRLADVQLVAVRGEESSDSVPEGAVIRTEPGAGAEVPRDSEVVVVVSTGPPLVEIPDVLGDVASDVADLLEGLGLDIAGVVGSPNREVVDLDPGPGSFVELGTDVTIYSQFLGQLD